jgi:hypothetical protein
MKTNRERGNALIYVLIAIALFAALSMTLGRQTSTSEANSLSDEKSELYATQLISYAAQAKSVIDQMILSGGNIDTLDFVLPGATDYDTGTAQEKIRRVYHPDGGGLIANRLPDDAVAYDGTDPVPGWYMGRFSNIEWTKTTGQDVVLVAFGINEKICQRINEKVTGTTDIPQMGNTIRNLMIDDEYHTGTNTDMMTDPAGSPNCAECDNMSSLCVEDQAGDIFAFYTIVADR